MATLIFLFSIVTNPVQAVPGVDAGAVEPAPVSQDEAQMRYYGVEQLLAKFEADQ